MTDIECLKKYLTAQPDRAEIEKMDRKTDQQHEADLKLAEAKKTNAAIKARRNIK